ncbi:MAG: VCBS repeat-containing protein, partial [Cyclobacteriaceae bacterium]|nr:VCBS repeat-containing protein [Cyclobacteriaceae bacterium]
MKNLLLTTLLGLVLFTSCSDPSEEIQLFVPKPSELTGIEFINSLQYTEGLNPYTFKNFYNGGGVGIGDFNNDGLADIFLCGNMVSNKLYLNKGDLKFEDITASANLERSTDWNTGVSLIDINSDGLLDIYVCKSGPPRGETRYNELFINNGDLTFSEQAASYGLDNIGLSVHAAFFDFDQDGDLDCYLLNNAIKSIGSFTVTQDKRLEPDSLGANKLYRNDNGHFQDITRESGIYSSEIGFGLGATVGDINDDGWPDIYISNDFFEKDYLYINQQNGTFEDQLEAYVKEISMGSMGADLADINNDGLPEYFVTEMLPERRDRQVTKTFFESWREQKNAQSKGYYNQFGRNVLQLNNGDGTFSEIGRYAGVAATDWSWSSLIFDMDNDGYKDIFVSNGIYKDLLDLDYLSFMSDGSRIRDIIRSSDNTIELMIDKMPSEAIPNYVLHNNGDLTFSNKALSWGMQEPTFSNGSAYGDLDNDGDLDLVVNNINMPSMIYENKSRQLFPQRNYLAMNLSGLGQNSKAVGAKISLYIDDQVLYQELNPMRGFESTVDYKLIFGVGEKQQVDSVLVIWPSGLSSKLYSVEVNQVLELSEADGVPRKAMAKKLKAALFRNYSDTTLAFNHQENDYIDFDKDRLLYHMNSTEGPCLCKGDVNNDGQDDVYIGGAHQQPGRLFVQSEAGGFRSHDQFTEHAQSEDLDCAFFDANGDGNQDLYVTSGGSEFSSISVWLNDRLYLGDGQGGFVHSGQKLPNKGYEATSVVIPWDYDHDGDLDLFVGGRSVPFYYGVPCDSYLLKNDGIGNFTDQSFELLKQLGLVTDATLADLDGDGNKELIVVGQWMPIKVFQISSGVMSDVSEQWGLDNSHGWYHTVEAADLNQDGRVDLVVGNHGLNSRFHASAEEPISLQVNDFDNNGTFEQIISMYIGGKEYPFVQLKELASQLPSIAQRYSSFNDYKHEEMSVLFPPELLAKGHVSQVFNLASGIYYNEGKQFAFEKLPARAQLSPVYAIVVEDFTGDGIADLLLGGNFSQSKPEVGTYQASYGTLLKGISNGQFRFMPNLETGLRVEGDIR